MATTVSNDNDGSDSDDHNNDRDHDCDKLPTMGHTTTTTLTLQVSNCDDGQQWRGRAVQCLVLLNCSPTCTRFGSITSTRPSSNIFNESGIWGVRVRVQDFYPGVTPGNHYLREADDGLDSDELSETDKATETNKKIRLLHVLHYSCCSDGTAVVQQSRAKKHVKCVIRQELVTRVQELHGAKLVDGSERQQKLTGGNVGRFTAEDLRCKNYANSSLRARYLTPPDAAEPQQSSVADPFDFGGLCDDDLDNVRPVLVKADACEDRREIQRHPTRETTRQAQGGQIKVPKATAKGTAYDRQESADLQPFPGACLDITEQCLSDSRWTHIFLPTLNHYLYLSKRPFADWTFESDTILPTIQTVFNLTFTNISYTLSLQDTVVKAAYNQMKTRRSKIASDVLQLVKAFFEGPQFENREDVKEYVFWALQSGGPAYYETPIPKSCKLKIDDPNSLKPDGFLRSRFILPITKSYMSLATKSALQPLLGPRNPPLGLYAMILTAVRWH
ncbi:hypothetical protein EI94DRAFT_1706466 [Lactarius quietus]|nr:hypothetical protein EI94DRAFT_1706466 [Lactarius quietus]